MDGVSNPAFHFVRLPAGDAVRIEASAEQAGLEESVWYDLIHEGWLYTPS